MATTTAGEMGVVMKAKVNCGEGKREVAFKTARYFKAFSRKAHVRRRTKGGQRNKKKEKKQR